MSTTVLAIETSCDETSVAVLRVDAAGEAQILAEEISSQTEVHRAYGGVVPELAAREHLSNLAVLLPKVIQESGVSLQALSGVVATRGPGLKGCLLIGTSAAKAIAIAHRKPYLGVNHIEGHILAARMEHPELSFPYLCLVVSGGHTEVHLVQGLGKYLLLGRTLDDAAGEAFDKSAQILGFDYPGGPLLAKLADSARTAAGADNKEQFFAALPRSMLDASDFSFSGLKTAISLLVRKHQAELQQEQRRAQLCAVIQEAIVGILVEKLERFVRQNAITRVVISGGVSANTLLRARVAALPGVQSFSASLRHCTDNAAMIGCAGALRLQRGEVGALDSSVLARWPVETLEG
jgi:N6-L-threonylcarbamoyladenine synthase